MQKYFTGLGIAPCDILLPAKNIDLNKWAMIACDQFTSQVEYWQEMDALVGQEPSTLRMIVPEAYLGRPGEDELQKNAVCAMKRYLKEGVFETYAQSMVYIRRSTPFVPLREGLIAAFDLEAYDYAPESTTAIRATEGTIARRLPPRIQVRKEAPLECPHIMMLLDDEEFSVIRALAETVTDADRLYQTKLAGNGGSIEGYRIHTDAQFAKLSQALRALQARKPFLYAIGDGNHSLAAALECWRALKPTLSEEERQNHPARYALAELVNLHDPGLVFHPIHRVIFTQQAEAFTRALLKELNVAPQATGTITLAYGETTEAITLPEPAVGLLQEALDKLVPALGARIDYVHDEDHCLKLAKEGNLAILLPPMDKGSLFSAVAEKGPLPRKAFSMGLAQEKRYYLECRTIQK